MDQVDVTVVLVVHDAMPQLTATLDALAGQSLRRRAGPALEVIAVDDGSTDGSGAELRRFAGRHPDFVRLLRQPYSGGPAGPANRAMALARGRYLLFLDAQERLGEHAVERLLALADRTSADVVLGRTAGAGGPPPPPALFERSRAQVGFAESALAWALSDAKLLRRALLERHGLRRREDLPVLSHWPFTLEVCLRAGRISVLAGHDGACAVRREDWAPVAVRSRHEDRLRALAAVLEVAGRLARPGAEREAIRARFFSWDVPGLLQADFLALDAAAQRRVCAGVGRLVELHCEEAALTQLPARDRLRLELARHGRVAALRRLIRYQAAYGESCEPAVAGQPQAAGEVGRAVVAPVAAVVPAVPVPVQVWRGLVPAPVRRRLYRRPAWRGFVARSYARWG